MAQFLITLFLVFSLGMASAWAWVSQNYLLFMNKDYPSFLAKSKLIDSYSTPGLVVIGDSIVRSAVFPTLMGPRATNLALGGASPVEDYFILRRFLRGPVHPLAVLLSFSPAHFCELDSFFENAVKVGMVDDEDFDDLLHEMDKRDDHFLKCSGPWDLDQRLQVFLTHRWFPPYFLSSILSAHFNGHETENRRILDENLETRGQICFIDYARDLSRSRHLNATARMGCFAVGVLFDDYFRRILSLLEMNHIPVYYVHPPINQYSVPAMQANGSLRGYTNYIDRIAEEDPDFHLLKGMNRYLIYPEDLCEDGSHLGPDGRGLFTRRLARVLNSAKVPGGPYGENE